MDKVTVGMTFASWDEFFQTMKDYTKETGQTLVKQGGKRVAVANGNIKMSHKFYPDTDALRYAYFVYHCSHRGVHIKRGSGIRRRTSKKMGCEAKIKAIVDRRLLLIVVETVNLNHNHPLDVKIPKPPRIRKPRKSRSKKLQTHVNQGTDCKSLPPDVSLKQESEKQPDHIYIQQGEAITTDGQYTVVVHERLKTPQDGFDDVEWTEEIESQPDHSYNQGEPSSTNDVHVQFVHERLKTLQANLGGRNHGEPSSTPVHRVQPKPRRLDMPSEDVTRAFAKTIAFKLKNLEAQQYFFAEKIINDVLYEARLGQLNRESCLVTNKPKGLYR